MTTTDKSRKHLINCIYDIRLISGVLTAAIVLSIVTASWTKDWKIRQINNDAAKHLESYNSYLHDKLSAYMVFSKILAHCPYIIGYLRHPGSQDSINEYLLDYNESIGASMTYIIGKDDTATASSNYKSPESAVGHNYQFRDYFQKAIKGTSTEDIAIGTVSKKLGYFRSYPVSDGVGGEILGVVVIKYDVNILTPQNTDDKDILLITDDHEVVFYSTDKRYLYHTIRKLSEDTLQHLKNHNAYSGQPLPPLPFIKESEKNGFKIVTMLHSDDSNYSSKPVETEYLMLGAQHNDSLWNVYLLVELTDVVYEQRKNVLLVLLVVLILYIVGVFMNYRAMSRQRLQESYDDLLRQKALLLEEKAKADKHIEEQETMNVVLRHSLSSEPLETHLQRNLDVIFERFAKFNNQRGCIFIYDDKERTLKMAVSRGCSARLLAHCATVSLGTCLCGLAAQTKEVVFSINCGDERHTTACNGMDDHGHFCVPIVSTDYQTDRLLGVINVYLDETYGLNVGEGLVNNEQDENFIKNIAGIIAGVILRKEELQHIEHSAAEGLTTLSAGIAHEINNPLAFVKSSVGSIGKYIAKIEQFMKDYQVPQGMDSEPKNSMFDVLTMINTKIESSNKGIARIIEVVNGLRSFSRLNKMEVEDKDINKCIDEALAMLSNEVGGAKVIKEYAELPLLACEPRAVNQCFYHILQNAFHAVAAAENDGVIRIMTSKTGIASELMQIVIEDNGTGMSEEAVRRAFVPFYTTKEVGLGKGLGLSIVDGIVKRHGGSVQLKSKQGSGTTVTIHLPIANELK